MGFLNPWALGLAAAAMTIPIVIHWLTRPRPTILPLSTIRFVMEAVKQRKARYRLRDWIVLALRMLAVGLLGLGFARPLLMARTAVTPQTSAGAARIIILDASQSMGAVSDGVAAFDRAKGVASRYLSDDAAWLNVIVAGARPHPLLARLSNNVLELRSELSEQQVRPERCDVASAIASAADLLAHAPSGGAAAQVVIVSDFQRSDWASADFSALPKDATIRLESVAAPHTPANLAILRVGAEGRLEVGREARLLVDVGNFSPASRQVDVDLNLGDSSIHFSGVCPAGATTTLAAPTTPAVAGWLGGSARLVGVSDALAADNTRPCALLVHPTPVYPILTRQPARAMAQSSYFIERALAPAAEEAGPAEQNPTPHLDGDNPDRAVLQSGDLIVLDHPGRLGNTTIATLCDLVRHGQPMLYVAAEPVDAENLRLISDAAGSDLKMPVTFFPAPPDQPRRNLFLADVRGTQPPFTVFGDALVALTRPLRFGGGLASRPAPGGVSDEVLATYNDQSACLVVTSLGAGRLGVLNADLGSSNLPASPAFVPLMQELASLLMGQQADQPAYSGERLRRYLPPGSGGADGLAVSPNPAFGPAGKFVTDGDAVAWDWDEAGPPAVYSVQRQGRTLFAVATAIPPSESDLESLDLSVLKDRLSGGRNMEIGSLADADTDQAGDRSWAWIISVCLGCVLLELTVLRAFRT